MKIIVLCFLTLIALTNILYQHKQVVGEPVIGGVYKNVAEVSLFKGYKVQEGLMLQPTSSNYCISRIAKGVHTIILLEQCIHEGATVKYKLLDTATVGDVGSGKNIIFSTCIINKKQDDKIIAYVEEGNKKYYKSILKAWKINLGTNKINSVSTKSVSCFNDAYDED